MKLSASIQLIRQLAGREAKAAEFEDNATGAVASRGNSRTSESERFSSEKRWAASRRISCSTKWQL